MDAKFIAKHQQLLQRREELRKRLQAIRQDVSQGLDRDWEEQAQQLENAEVLDEIARLTAEELSKIEQGIERLEQAFERDARKH